MIPCQGILDISKIRCYKPKTISEPVIASQIEILNARWFIWGNIDEYKLFHFGCIL